MHPRIARLPLAATFLFAAAAFSQTMSPPAVNSPSAAPATTWPTTDGTIVLQNIRFGSGETLPQLRLHFLTLGTPHRNAAGHVDNAVLLLHGTGGNAHSLLNPLFSNVLFVPGAPLDIRKYFLILPDDIGHGQSSKPSDGLHAHFPAYDYDDMVRSQRMMLDEMKIDHLRLILGTSMGCMQTFVWGETYPGFADALAPFACLPVQIAGRNRMMRYMAIQAVKQDPAWMGGEYKTEPVQGLRTANEMILVMGSSPLQMQKQAPTRDQAEKYVDDTCKRIALARTPTTSSTTATPAATTTPARISTRSPRRCCGSTPPTTTSTRPSWASPKRWSSACPMRASFSSHLRCHPRPRNPYSCRRLEGLPGGFHASHRAQAIARPQDRANPGSTRHGRQAGHGRNLALEARSV